MYSIWFETELWGDDCLFITGIPTLELAERIASSLVDEKFVARTWIEQD